MVAILKTVICHVIVNFFVKYVKFICLIVKYTLLLLKLFLYVK